MSNPDVNEGADFPATAVFVLVDGLKDCTDGPKVPAALQALHDALRAVDASAFVLSTIAGAIVVIPDTSSWTLDATLAALERASVGFALRVGVAHGLVDAVTDVDDEPNLVGPPINIAARLATSPANPGVLIHDTYARFVDATLGEKHWLHRSRRTAISVTGKPQDPAFVCFAGPRTFPARPLEPHAEPSWTTAVLIAYDLPRFSAGDRAQLRKRFAQLGSAFQKLRQSPPLSTAVARLSPGGDGGVLVLEGVSLEAAAMMSSQLQRLTEIETLGRSEDLAVRLRMGVHHGRVTRYRNARGVERPAGLTVFVADEIANDAHARAASGIVFTSLLVDSVTGGSRERLASEFEPLPPIPSGPAAGVDRFVPRAPSRPR